MSGEGILIQGVNLVGGSEAWREGFRDFVRE